MPVCRTCKIFRRSDVFTVCLTMLMKEDRAQGAAMAIEDGGVLGQLFSKITDASQISTVLKIYEALRKPRTTRVVQSSLEQGLTCKLRDGEKQQERDRLFTTPELDEYPVHFAKRKFRDFLLGYDAFAEVDQAWKGREGS